MAKRYVLAMGAVLAAAGGSGFLTAQALGTGSQEPARTVTLSVTNGTNGERGPQGPPGPPGPPGGQTCREGFSRGVLVLNAPGGQVTMETCLEDE